MIFDAQTLKVRSLDATMEELIVRLQSSGARISAYGRFLVSLRYRMRLDVYVQL